MILTSVATLSRVYVFNRLIASLVLLLSMPSCATWAKPDCGELTGLFQERQKIRSALSSGRSSELGAVDTKYRQLFADILRSGDKARFKQCPLCEGGLVRQDDYLGLACGLATFRKGHKLEKFIKGVPKTKAKADSLWDMDAIVLGGQEGRKPKDIPPSFVNEYLDAVFEGASKGSVEALTRLFELAQWSDGEYAEYLTELIGRLFAHNLKVIVKNWPTIGPLAKSFGLGSTDFSTNADKALDDLGQMHTQKMMDESTYHDIKAYIESQKSGE